MLGGNLIIIGNVQTTGPNAGLAFNTPDDARQWLWHGDSASGGARLWCSNPVGDKIWIGTDGSVTATGAFLTQGVNAGYYFYQRDNARYWQWYAPAGTTARLWNSVGGDVLVITSDANAQFNGAITASNAIQSQGINGALGFAQRDGSRNWLWYAPSTPNNIEARLWNNITGDVAAFDSSGALYFRKAGSTLAFFDDGNSHIEASIQLWINSGSTVPINLCGDVHLTKNVFIEVGSLQVGVGAVGQVRITPGGASAAGYVGIWEPSGTRLGYFGYSTAYPSLVVEVGGVFAIINGGIRLVTAGQSYALMDAYGTYSFFLQTQGTISYINFVSDTNIRWDGGSGTLYWRWGGVDFWVWRNDLICYNNRGAVGGYGAYANFSDRRMKENIEPAIEGLKEILQLNPVTFNRVRRFGEDEKTIRPQQEIGFIAQEVLPVLPQAVRVAGIELHDRTGGLNHDEPTLSLTSETITAALVNAVKELHAEIEMLKARL